MSSFDVERSHFRGNVQTMQGYHYLVACERLSLTGWTEEEGVGWHGPVKTEDALDDLADARNERNQRLLNRVGMNRARNRLRNLHNEPSPHELDPGQVETHTRVQDGRRTFHHTIKD